MNKWEANPWTNPMENTQNGEVFMLYPPSETNGEIGYGSKNHKFVSSIRFEILRDGLEDYEYKNWQEAEINIEIPGLYIVKVVHEGSISCH